MDMSKSYRSAVEQFLPEVDIVFDRFHVMQLVTKAIDKVRGKQQKQMDEENCKTLKGNRFLLLANYENLTPDETERLDIALSVNAPLFIIHTMKEQLRLLWSKPSRKIGRRFLATWIMDAIEAADNYHKITEAKVLEPLRKLAHTLMKHFRGILNFFDHPVTNGKIEGINNKIKTLKRQAYGYRDNEYFKLRLLHLHKQKTRLAG
jgi:transposase